MGGGGRPGNNFPRDSRGDKLPLIPPFPRPLLDFRLICISSLIKFDMEELSLEYSIILLIKVHGKALLVSFTPRDILCQTRAFTSFTSSSLGQRMKVNRSTTALTDITPLTSGSPSSLLFYSVRGTSDSRCAVVSVLNDLV